MFINFEGCNNKKATCDIWIKIRSWENIPALIVLISINGKDHQIEKESSSLKLIITYKKKLNSKYFISNKFYEFFVFGISILCCS